MRPSIDLPKKIKTITTIGEIVERIKAQKKTIVFTNGCFDILHAGHVDYLQKTAALADCLIIGLNSDKSVKKLKGDKRPIIYQEDRAFLLAALQIVDYVAVFDEETPFELISIVKPDVLVKGGEYQIHEIVGADIVMQNKGKVVTMDMVAGKSTSNVIDKVLKQS